MKKFGFYLFLMLLCSLLVIIQLGFSQTETSINRVGTTAAQFLKISAGALPICMGGAYTALATDILAVYWNPAGLSRIVGNGEAVFNHAEWLAETDYEIGRA